MLKVNTNIRVYVLILVIILSFSCSKKTVAQDAVNVVSATDQDGKLFTGNIAVSKNYILKLDNTFMLSWPEDASGSWFFLESQNVKISITLGKADDQTKEELRNSINKYEQPEKYVSGAIEYLGSYISRASLEDPNPGFIGIVFKGDSMLYLEFSLADNKYVEEAREIWKSAH